MVRMSLDVNLAAFLLAIDDENSALERKLQE